MATTKTANPINTLVGGILGGLTSIGTANARATDNRQDTKDNSLAAREITNANVVQKVNLLVGIDGGIDFDPTTNGMRINLDNASMVQTNQLISGVKISTMQNNVLGEVTLKSIIANPDRPGTFTGVAINANGDEVPLTVNGTNDPDDQVLNITQKQIEDQIRGNLLASMAFTKQKPDQLFQVMTTKIPRLSPPSLGGENSRTTETNAKAKAEEVIERGVVYGEKTNAIDLLLKKQLAEDLGEPNLSEEKQNALNANYNAAVRNLKAGSIPEAQLDKLGASYYDGDLSKFIASLDAATGKTDAGKTDAAETDAAETDAAPTFASVIRDESRNIEGPEYDNFLGYQERIDLANKGRGGKGDIAGVARRSIAKQFRSDVTKILKESDYGQYGGDPEYLVEAFSGGAFSSRSSRVGTEQLSDMLDRLVKLPQGPELGENLMKLEQAIKTYRGSTPKRLGLVDARRTNVNKTDSREEDYRMEPRSRGRNYDRIMTDGDLALLVDSVLPPEEAAQVVDPKVIEGITPDKFRELANDPDFIKALDPEIVAGKAKQIANDNGIRSLQDVAGLNARDSFGIAVAVAGASNTEPGSTQWNTLVNGVMNIANGRPYDETSSNRATNRSSRVSQRNSRLTAATASNKLTGGVSENLEESSNLVNAFLGADKDDKEAAKQAAATSLAATTREIQSVMAQIKDKTLNVRPNQFRNFAQAQITLLEERFRFSLGTDTNAGWLEKIKEFFKYDGDPTALFTYENLNVSGVGPDGEINDATTIRFNHNSSEISYKELKALMGPTAAKDDFEFLAQLKAFQKNNQRAAAKKK